MMVGGIVMVSLAPVGLLVAGVAGLGKSVCEIDKPDNYRCNGYDSVIYGSLITSLVLVSAGIPLIVIGAKKEPVDPSDETATVAPWATPNAAGVSLRLRL